MKIEIDQHSGFCFGVRKAISKVEELTSSGTALQCLGDIVHNQEEISRLSELGMHTISLNEAGNLNNSTVLIRTHGEPPATYEKLKLGKNEIIDATCPVVLKLQNRIKKSYQTQQQQNGQLVIYGKKGHAEVIGLNGQTGNSAIIVSSSEDVRQIDFTRPIELYCQTTMSLDGFREISSLVQQQAKSECIVHDTICRQVSNRVPQLKEFAGKHDAIVFISGKKSSNGKFLASVCKSENPATYVIAHVSELKPEWFQEVQSVGICGATSTPQWLMQDAANWLNKLHN